MGEKRDISFSGIAKGKVVMLLQTNFTHAPVRTLMKLTGLQKNTGMKVKGEKLVTWESD